MAKAQTAPPPDHNGGDESVMEIVKDSTAKIIALERQRKAINDNITKERSSIKALNIDMDAWRASKRRQEMDPDVRAEFDRSQALCNAALGVPINAKQGSLFGAEDDEDHDNIIPAGAVAN